MDVKRGISEDVYGMVLQRLRDMAKAGLPEPQSPVVKPSHSSVARLYTRRHWYAWNQLSSRLRPDQWTMCSEHIQGDERGA